MQPIDHKEKLINWHSRQDEVTPEFIRKWYKLEVCKQYLDAAVGKEATGRCHAYI